MASLEILQPRGYAQVTLDGDRLTIGKSDDNDLAIAGDPTLSRHHALLGRVGAAWSVSDLGAKNSTLVNGQRVVGTQVLKHADELTLGETRILFRDQASARGDTTMKKKPPPRLTPTEHEVLVELVRPWGTGSAFTPPALVKDIAAARFTTEAAVKNVLGRLYDKFDIFDDGTNRRVRLANAAWESGAVGPRDLHSGDDEG
jgi:pSer/pThr/pTyr-binding forkhead associated (FHA) protein